MRKNLTNHWYFQGKIRDVDLGADTPADCNDSSASAESETDDVSIDIYYSVVKLIK